MGDRAWSPQQEEIFSWFGAGRGVGNLVVRARAGCIQGDAEIGINRGGNGKRLPLADLVAKFNGVEIRTHVAAGKMPEHSRAERSWDLSIPTFVQQERDGVMRLARLKDAWASGEKRTYTVTTNTGRKIRATAEHPFLTARGWVQLQRLQIGDFVHVKGEQAGAGRAPKKFYPDVSHMEAHPFAVHRREDRSHPTGTARVPVHRLMVEAARNNLAWADYIFRVQAGDIEGFQFLDPAVEEVHHKDRDPRNNNLSNLEVVSPEEHGHLHAEEGGFKNVLFDIVVEEVVEVVLYGFEATYDLEIDDEYPHNFIANGFVVHNTGKTSTILEGIGRSPERSILLCAFNKRIQEELQGRLSNPRAEARTLHALGFAAVKEEWEGVRVAKNPLFDRAYALTDAIVGPNATKAVRRLVTKLHTLARETLPHATSPEELDDLAVAFDCEPEERSGTSTAEVCQYAVDAMELAASALPPAGIDFADMIFLPVRNGWMRAQYDLVCVDESQDMTVAQLELALGATIAKGRVVVVGDDRQAIYGFRGADSGALDRLKRELCARELGLTTTYRCSQSVVREAQRLVPDIEAAASNPEGFVLHLDDDRLHSKLIESASDRREDFVLSRTNAPLARVALALLRKGTRARIAGKDIGAGLRAIVEKLSPRPDAPIETFLSRLDDWERSEVDRAVRLKRSEAQIDAIYDRADTLRAVADADDLSTDNRIGSLLNRIDSLFADSGSRQVVCSTVHKAKGLEVERVFVLDDTLYRFSTDLEEQNIEYVAVTRAIDTLVRVGGGEKV